VAAAQQGTDLVDVERALGDEDHVGPARESRVEGDPARVAAHHLDDQDAVVALGGGVEPVYGVRRDLHGGVEAEGHVRAAQVVVDRLGDADEGKPRLVEAVGGAQRVLAADRDEAVQVERRHVGADDLDAVLALEGVGARGPEDGAAAGQDAARRLDRELDVAVLERPSPAVAEADDGVAVHVDPLADHGADDRVQPRAVATAGEHANPHGASF
jgi:hypothetical protein